MREGTLVDEKALVKAAQAGDREAFVALYEAYATPIFDFSLRMLRNRADAEDVTSDVFLKAMERLGSLKDPAAFKGWLYSIARNASLSLIDSRGRVSPVAEHFESADNSELAVAPPDTRAEEGDLKELVWDAAATLNPRDYAVFELAVRQGLSSREIADALEVRPAYAYILVNRLKSSVAEALEAVLLVRTGRSNCPELASLVESYGEESTPRLRKAVSRHAKSCEDCTRTRSGRASVTALLQGTAFAEPSAAFREGLAQKIRDGWKTPAAVSSAGLGAFAAAIGAVVVAATVAVGATPQRTIGTDNLVKVERVMIADPEDEPAPAEQNSPPTVPTQQTEPQTAPEPQPEADSDGGSSEVTVIEGRVEGESSSSNNDDRDSDRSTEPPRPRP